MENCSGGAHERIEKEYLDSLNFSVVDMRISNPKATLYLVSCVLGMISTESLAQTAFEKEKEAIMAVITQETTSFMNVDRQKWSESWMQTPYAYWSFADSTGSSSLDGWSTINQTYDTYFKTQKPSKARITNNWIEVRIYKNGAYARFTQTVEDEIDTEVTSQSRVLEKKGGRWKIVCVAVAAIYPKK